MHSWAKWIFSLLSSVCYQILFYDAFVQFISRTSFQMSHEIDGPKICIGCTWMTFLQFELSLGQNTQLMERLRGLKKDTGRKIFGNAQKLNDIFAWYCFLCKLLIWLEQATSGSINYFGSHVEVAFGIWLMATFIHVENYSCWLWEEKNLFFARGLQPTVTKKYWIDFRENQIRVITDNGDEEIW